MPSVSISGARAQGLDGVCFTASADGAQQEFMVTRESLEDLEYTMLESAQAMLQAFERQRAQIGLVAAKAMQEGPPGRPVVTLQSLLA
jgi:hypothetical protein